MLKSVEKREFQYQKNILDMISQANTVILDIEEVIRLSICAIISRGHILIEDIPGMGKTSLVKTLSMLLGLPNARIQFTNDMLPADILGTTVWNKGQWERVDPTDVVAPMRLILGGFRYHQIDEGEFKNNNAFNEAFIDFESKWYNLAIQHSTFNLLF